MKEKHKMDKWDKWILSIIITIILILLVITIYRHEQNQDKLMFNVNMRIVSIDGKNIDEFPRHQSCHEILFETIRGEKLYRAINTCNIDNYHQKLNIDTKWIYVHNVGDTVHFDYLLRSEFFKLKSK